jgi:cell division protein FtsN
MMFGAVASQIAPTPEMEVVQPTPSIIPAIPKYVPVAQAIPAPSPAYDNLDVVSIEEQGRFNTRAVFNEPSNTYANSAVVSIDEENTAVSSGGNYYIQVAALFSKDGANSNYFGKLDSAGLNHQLKQTTVRGRPVKLLLVGPYNSSADARADLSRAKSIEKGAFIKKFNG